MNKTELTQVNRAYGDMIRRFSSENGTDEFQTREELKNFLLTEDFADAIYEPSPILISRIDDYNKWLVTGKGENAGELMEEIMFLAFKCLKGNPVIQNFQSYAPQHDLVVNGNSSFWFELMEYLHLPKDGRTIVAEAKNLNKKVDDQQFSRLCHTIQNKFNVMCHLGVFFSRNGATGFYSTRALRDARATQILFHVKTDKFVIVLESKDIQQLVNKGALPKILERKIADVEQGANAPLEVDDGEWRVMASLPKHLAKYIA